ncbi:RNase A-like domain-containing protein [Brenneria goodwinii]|uniref:RNase A-like domain-containing protein n=1 Tax=Brenneria goodwinii TaxID=1109412 RepID=UPI0036EC0BA5
MEDALRVTISPVQLAAVLSDQSVTEAETLSNRLLGGLGLALGSLELAGATALCLVPEPTTLTKVGCVVVGAHSLDSINAAANQVITGRDTRTATYESAVALAKQFGADDSTAWKIGLTVDIAVPVGFALAIGAVRVASVRMGRIKLIEHESVTGLKPGGHTLEKHVGKTESDLRERLVRCPTLPSSSTFYNVRIAEDAISRALKFNETYIKHWAKTAKTGARLNIDFFTGSDVGIGVKTATGPVIKSHKIRLVLELQYYNSKLYYILTAFPRVE